MTTSAKGPGKGRPRAAFWAIAAARLGVSLEVYTANREAGRRWCYVCRRFRSGDRFGPDKCRRGGGVDGCCVACRNERDDGRERNRRRPGEQQGATA